MPGLGRKSWVTAQRFPGADSGSVLASHRSSRHTPRHARLQASRHARESRRGPSRLTLAVAAATVASASVAASISVGISLAAGPGPSSASQASGSTASAALSPGSSSGAARRARSGKPDSAGAVARGSAAGKAASPKVAPGKSGPHKIPAAAAKKNALSSPASKAKPYLIYDSVDPQAIPAGQVVATYATGAHPVPTSAVAGRRRVIWIDTLGTDPSANELDIEPGCASPAQAAGWVRARLTTHPGATAILYSSISEWSEIRADVASLPAWMRAKIRWWIADPTGSPHMVPGAQATQWYWGPNYDISTALPGLT